MPSTLYQSVKKSVIQFAEIRKKNEKVQDKLLFRWKLITLGLSIVFIVLIGAFSQILKLVNSLPDVVDQKSFILPILKTSSDSSIPTVLQASNLLDGITYTLDKNQIEYAFNSASLVYDFTNNGGAIFNLTNMISKINNKEKLVFIFSTKDTLVGRFAFFSYHKYTESSNAAIEDSSDSRYSTFFSLEKKSSIIPVQTSNCPLFRRQLNSLFLFQSIQLKDGGLFTVKATNTNYSCYSATDLTTSNQNIGDIINVNLVGLNKVDVTLDSLQIYSIYLNDS